MITTAELHEAAQREGLRFGQAEKDYVILCVTQGGDGRRPRDGVDREERMINVHQSLVREVSDLENGTLRLSAGGR